VVTGKLKEEEDALKRRCRKRPLGRCFRKGLKAWNSQENF